MGYIDDKAREADNTIKGIGIVVVVVIALIAIFGSIEGGIGAFAVIMSLAFVGSIVWLVHVIRKENRQNRQAKQNQNEAFKLCKERYYVRMKELGFEKTDQLTIWMKYTDCDKYFKEYIWVKNNQMWVILAEPDEETYLTNPKYDNLQEIKPLYRDISNINRIAIEGDYCVLYSNWKPFYYRKDAIEVFRKLIPSKVQ